MTSTTPAPAPVRRAYVRRPSPRMGEGLLTHLDRVEVDADLAMTQWRAYCDALAAHGVGVVEVPPADEHPDAAFVEDVMVADGTRVIVTRPGDPARRGETDGLAAFLQAEGLEAAVMDEPARLDGGDVLRVGATAFVGTGGRSDDAGIAALADWFGPAAEGGYDVVAVPVESVLHLKSAVTALPDGRVLGLPELVDHPEVFEAFTPVEEEPGSHVVVLDERTVLMAASAPRTAEWLRGQGLNVITVDISEFEKMEGCVTCLSVRIRG